MFDDEIYDNDIKSGSGSSYQEGSGSTDNNYRYFEETYPGRDTDSEYVYGRDYNRRTSSGSSFGPGNGGGNRNKDKKKGGFGKAIAKAICLGLVFGLSASLVMFGVNKATGAQLAQNNSQTSAVGTTNSSGGTGTVSIVQTSSNGVQTTDSDDVSDIVEQVMPGIVAVNTVVEQTGIDWFGRQYTQESEGAGSGIIISESDGNLYVMTNYHVVEGASTVSVQFVDDSSATATVKGYDADGDIAVIVVDMSQLSAETKEAIAVSVLGDSDSIKAGNSAIAIGNALGYGQSVTTGVISAAAREVELTDKTMTLIQTSAAINPGNSGGALLNGKGEVIGVNTVKFSETSVEGMGYAIPINTAIETAKGIIDGTIVPKTDDNTAYLGITGGTIDEDTAKQYNMPTGVYISSVMRGSAAQMAGLESGCVITGFNGQDITTMEELQEGIAKCSPGDKVTIKAQFADRNGEYTERELTTVLGAKSDIQE